MSSQSSTSTRLGRRSAAALGTSASRLPGSSPGRSLAVELPDPVSGSQPSSASTSCGYVGGGSVVSCADQSSASSASGAGSANSAEQGTPRRRRTRVAPRSSCPRPSRPTCPWSVIGVAAAVVVAGGLLIASTNRRRRRLTPRDPVWSPRLIASRPVVPWTFPGHVDAPTRPDGIRPSCVAGPAAHAPQNECSRPGPRGVCRREPCPGARFSRDPARECSIIAGSRTMTADEGP